MVTTQRLEVAEALLAKARSTTFPDERESFLAGALGQIDAYLQAAGRPSATQPVPPVAVHQAGGAFAESVTATPAEEDAPEGVRLTRTPADWPRRGRIIRYSDARRTGTARAAYRASGSAVRPGTIIDLTL